MTSSLFIRYCLPALLASFALAPATGALAADAPAGAPSDPPESSGGEKEGSAESSGDPPPTINLSNFPGQVVDKVVVPIPAEIFAVLDKLDEPDWRGAIDLPVESHSFRERAFLAMNFGCVVAEGFIAVQAKDSGAIQDIGRRALKLADSLGLASAVRPHSLSIVEAADKGQWDLVRRELDSTQQTVKDTMEQLRDDELSHLVSLGGWLRGTHVVTQLIVASYSEAKAELLQQPGLIGHFNEVLAKMKDPAKDSQEMKAVIEGLAKLEEQVGAEGGISEETVGAMNATARKMLEQIYFPKPDTKSGAGDKSE